MTRILVDTYFLYVLPKNRSGYLFHWALMTDCHFAMVSRANSLFSQLFLNMPSYIFLQIKTARKSSADLTYFVDKKMRTKIVINVPKGTALLDFYLITQNFKLDKKNDKSPECFQVQFQTTFKLEKQLQTEALLSKSPLPAIVFIWLSLKPVYCLKQAQCQQKRMMICILF